MMHDMMTGGWRRNRNRYSRARRAAECEPGRAVGSNTPPARMPV